MTNFQAWPIAASRLMRMLTGNHILEYSCCNSVIATVASNQARRFTCCTMSSKGMCNTKHQSSGVLQYRDFSKLKTSDENSLINHLQNRIRLGGPLTVADYMKEVLTNTQSGYYMNKDVFGSKGDFITSPEISQMFGEMLGIWVVNEWMNNYDGKHLQLVELGPGRGTLADDMLRVFSQFPTISDKISLCLVEVSPTLSQIQEAKLSGNDLTTVEKGLIETDDCGSYRRSVSKYGQEISWYKHLRDVPEALTCYIAHEFLDALPIHKFQKTERGWCEVLIDMDNSSTKLRYVLSPGQTAACVAYLKPELIPDNTTHAEVCPGAGLVVEDISRRIGQHGGFALLADYAHSGEKSDTFRAFKNHQLHNPLEEPGTADLTADVNFSYLKLFTGSKVSFFGPITQEKFLTNMGIGVRLQVLLKNTAQEDWPSLISGYKMLTSPEQMGERFKFVSIMENLQHNYMPAGFVDLNL